MVHEAEVVNEGETKEATKQAAPQSSEKAVGTSKKHEFQAETKKILDIVVRSLYTDREVHTYIVCYFNNNTTLGFC